MSRMVHGTAGNVPGKGLFEEALGLEWPWYVERRAFDSTKRRLSLYLNFEAGGTFRCGACGTGGCKAYDTVLKRWRHLDFFRCQTFLHAPFAPGRMHALRGSGRRICHGLGGEGG